MSQPWFVFSRPESMIRQWRISSQTFSTDMKKNYTKKAVKKDIPSENVAVSNG